MTCRRSSRSTPRMKTAMAIDDRANAGMSVIRLWLLRTNTGEVTSSSVVARGCRVNRRDSESMASAAATANGTKVRWSHCSE